MPDRKQIPSAGSASVISTVTLPGNAPDRVPRLTVEDLMFLSDIDRFEALAAALPHMTAEDIAPLAERLAASLEQVPRDPFAGDGTVISALLRPLFLRWAEIDAAGLMTSLEGPAFRFCPAARALAVCACAELSGAAIVEEAGARWPGAVQAAAWEILYRQPEQMEALIPWLGQTPVDEKEVQHIREVLGPERALKLGVALRRNDWMHTIVEPVVARNFQGAVQMVKAMPAGAAKDEAMVCVLAGYRQIFIPESGEGSEAEMDSFAQEMQECAARSALVRREYEALPTGQLRDRLTNCYIEILAAQNIESAIKAVLSLRDRDVRAEAVRALLEGPPPEGLTPEMAVQLVANEIGAGMRVSRDNNLLTDKFRQWCNADPSAAEAWFKTLSDTDLRESLVPVLPARPGHDLNLFSSSEARMKYEVDLLHKPEGLRGETPSASQVPEAWTQMARLTGIARDGVPRENWLAAGTEERRFLSAEAVASRAKNLPRQMAVDFFEAMSPAERSLGAWYEAGKARIVLNLEAASQWMAALPPGAERDAASTALVEYLTGAGEARETTRARSNMLSGTDTDTASERDAEAAFAWAAGMSGETERVRYAAIAAKIWAEEDPGAARAAVEAARLPDAAKQSLLQGLPEAGTP